MTTTKKDSYMFLIMIGFILGAFGINHSSWLIWFSGIIIGGSIGYATMYEKCKLSMAIKFSSNTKFEITYCPKMFGFQEIKGTKQVFWNHPNSNLIFTNLPFLSNLNEEQLENIVKLWLSKTKFSIESSETNLNLYENVNGHKNILIFDKYQKNKKQQLYSIIEHFKKTDIKPIQLKDLNKDIIQDLFSKNIDYFRPLYNDIAS